MAGEIEGRVAAEHEQSSPLNTRGWPQRTILALAALLIVYLCWQMIQPFLPAVCWALALAMIAEPLYSRLVKRSVPRGIAALLILCLVVVVVIGPCVLLGRALVREASDIVDRLGVNNGTVDFRQAVVNNAVLGPVVRWLDARFDLPAEAMQIVRTLAGFASAAASAFITSSVWLLGQIGVTLLVLFYLLRDQETIIQQSRSLIPISPTTVDIAFSRIAQTIRVSLGGKIVVAFIQGALGGLMFSWLGFTAPVFWGFVMAALSIFPVIGAFLVWAPAALFLALQDKWRDALLLAGWGILIVSQIDNVIGPMLIGTRLRMHTLLTFFSIVGGIAAFGASGIVLGPITIGIVVAVLEARSRNLT